MRNYGFTNHREHKENRMRDWKNLTIANIESDSVKKIPKNCTPVSKLEINGIIIATRQQINMKRSTNSSVESNEVENEAA